MSSYLVERPREPLVFAVHKLMRFFLCHCPRILVGESRVCITHLLGSSGECAGRLESPRARCVWDPGCSLAEGTGAESEQKAAVCGCWDRGEMAGVSPVAPCFTSRYSGDVCPSLCVPSVFHLPACTMVQAPILSPELLQQPQNCLPTLSLTCFTPFSTQHEEM